MSSKPTSDIDQLVDQVSELKHMLGQFGRLIEISLTLNSTLDQENILKFIIKTAAEIMDCEAVSILLYDEKKEELRIADSTDSNPEELAKIPVPLDNSIAGTIFLQNSPQIINKIEKNPKHFQMVGEIVQFETRSLVGVPMRIRNKVTGVLEGLNKRDGDFTMDDLDILAVIASQAAVAINNARLMEELKEAYDDLSHIDKIKSDFIAIASHELRTPVFHIMGYAQMIQEDTEGEAQDNAKRVMDSTMQLKSLLDSMTNMNLLEMGARELELGNLPLQQILVDAYKETLGSVKSKGHNIDFDMPKMPLYVMADPLKLERAFVNVFNNAVRFTPKGGEIKIKVIEHKKDGHAHISISDTGIGIKKDELENVFTRFYQTQDHLTRSHSGMGLGLAIARGVVELHGGKMWAESEGKNKGTTIQITIPLV